MNTFSKLCYLEIGALSVIILVPKKPASLELCVLAVVLLVGQNLIFVSVPANVTCRTSPRVSLQWAVRGTWCTTNAPRSNQMKTSPAQGHGASRWGRFLTQAPSLVPFTASACLLCSWPWLYTRVWQMARSGIWLCFSSSEANTQKCRQLCGVDTWVHRVSGWMHLLLIRDVNKLRLWLWSWAWITSAWLSARAGQTKEILHNDHVLSCSYFATSHWPGDPIEPRGIPPQLT